MEEMLEMSTKELERYRILLEIKNKQITQLKGAELLNLSARQVRTLICQLKSFGPKGLISKKRGKVSNRSCDPQIKKKVIHLIEEHYQDFGPTLISEKLLEKHQIKISNETIRQWMIQKHDWVIKQRKKNRHRLRERKACFGELIQIDGSHHDWFEGRRAKCVLIVFIDDATSKLTSLYFAEGETLDAYFYTLENHLKIYGAPRQIYSDRFSIFESAKENLTQFKQALKLLNISHITARTPQAKGRVERVNQTLQDRLIKEMRLLGISTIEEANEFCKKYILLHNQKFSKEPASTFDAHRPLETDLSRILCRYEERTLANDLSIHFHNKIYQICEEKDFKLPKKAKIEVRQQRDGNLRFFFKEQELIFIPYEECPYERCFKPQEWHAKNWKSQLPAHPWKSKTFNTHLKTEQMKRVI